MQPEPVSLTIMFVFIHQAGSNLNDNNKRNLDYKH